MTTVASIIQSAMRETNLIALGVTVTTAQQAEAFGLLSTIVTSAIGNDAGEALVPMPLGKNKINAPQGYPWWGNNLPADIFVPANTRLMCNLTGPATVNLDPNPSDGARMGFVDISNNFATYPLTINGNGRMIEGSSSQVYSTSGATREWLYREDLGNWVVVNPITLTGDMPFPSDHDDYFIISLAMRLNPRYGRTMDPATMAVLKEAASQFSARYKQSHQQMPSEIGLTRLTNTDRGYYGDPNAFFNSGVPY